MRYPCSQTSVSIPGFTNLQLAATEIAGFICPSTPRSANTIQFGAPASALQTSPIPAGFTVAAGGPLAPLGVCDYMVGLDVHSNYYAANNIPNPNPQLGNGVVNGTTGLGWGQGALTTFTIADIPAMTAGQAYEVPRGCTIAYITDGTSNTVLSGEVAGRFNLTVTGNIQITQANAGPNATFPTGIGLVAQQDNFVVSGAGWADTFSGDMELSGRAYDGGLSGFQQNINPGSGPCGVNCSNQRTRKGNGDGDGGGFYSWHPGGAHLAMCDGSVRFISQNISGTTLAAIITAQTGDLPGAF